MSTAPKILLEMLPELPAPAIVDPNRFGMGWTAEQMQAYATDAVLLALDGKHINSLTFVINAK